MKIYKDHLNFLKEEKLIFIPQWVKVLGFASLRDIPITKIAKELDTFGVHLYKIIGILEKSNLLSSEKRGRNVYISVTPEGRELGNDCYNICLKFSIIKREVYYGR